MYIFARSRRRAAAPSTPTPTRRYGFDRVELLCFLIRLMIILGVVAMALQSHGIH
jgi:hypothetical protein